MNASQCAVGVGARLNLASAPGVRTIRLAQQVSEIELASNEYIDPNNGRGRQLGFIIEDMPDLAAITDDGQRVSMYA